MLNETAMQLMKQQTTQQFSTLQSTIPLPLHKARAFFSQQFLIYYFMSKVSLLLTTAVSFVQISQIYRLTEQQCNGHTW